MSAGTEPERRGRALEGRIAIVTGSGRGIGEVIARDLARAGTAVVVCSRSEEEIGRVAEEIRQDGGDATAIPADVTSEAEVEELESAALERFGRIDILVNNAGTATSAPLEQIELESWNRTLAVNATGVLLCTRAFAPRMAEAGWGRVVNVASIAGLAGGRYLGAYSASKHAVIGLTRSIALEMADRGVTVNAVCPGWVDTAMTSKALDNIVAKTGMDREQALATVLEEMPQRRLLRPEEIAHAVMMLCYPEAEGINGETIVIDGGRGTA